MALRYDFRASPFVLATASLLTLSLHAQTNLPAIRWKIGAPGCTLTRGTDGKYGYGLQTKDLSVTLRVDAQELQLTRRRLSHFLGVFVEARYEGAGSLVFDPGTATIEYVDHYRVIKGSLDPDDFAGQIESGAEQVSEEADRSRSIRSGKKSAKRWRKPTRRTPPNSWSSSTPR